MFRVALTLALGGWWLASPAPLFLYEAGPDAGYVLTQPVPLPAPWKPLPQKKFYIGNGNQNNFKFVNERQVDSYFRLLRKSPLATATAPRAEQSRTEPPVQRQHSVKDTDETAHSPLPRRYRDEKPTPADVAASAEDHRKLNRKDYFRKQHVFEKQSVGSRGRKPIIEANFHRSDRRPPREQHFLRGTPVKDKILHKASVGELANAPRGRMKEYHKRDTVDKRSGRDQPSRDISRSTLHVTGDGGNGFSRSGQHKPAYAAFYGMSPDPEAPSQLAGGPAGEADAAYYRGNASNFVDILTERKGAKTIGARALDDALQSLLF